MAMTVTAVAVERSGPAIRAALVEHAPGERHGFTAFDDRSRRLHLLLDAYGYGGDRSAFGAAVAARARLNAAGIHRLATGGDPMYVALLPGAADLEQAAREVEALPASFWLHPGRSRDRRGPA